MLELKNIHFERDNKKILNNVSLIIPDNNFTVITGPNGSGKSTLAKIIIGIERPDSGTIIYNGKDITNLPLNERAKLGMAFAFQQPVKFKGITVHDILSIAAHSNLTKHEACEILSKVGLCAKEYVDREISNTLSGGELKRIEIATVIARNPNFAIFDEPEAGIDLWSFNNLIECFREINKDKNKSTLIISHQERILDIADNIILMKNGKIVQIGDKDSIYTLKHTNKKCCIKERRFVNAKNR